MKFTSHEIIVIVRNKEPDNCVLVINNIQTDTLPKVLAQEINNKLNELQRDILNRDKDQKKLKLSINDLKGRKLNDCPNGSCDL